MFKGKLGRVRQFAAEKVQRRKNNALEKELNAKYIADLSGEDGASKAGDGDSDDAADAKPMFRIQDFQAQREAVSASVLAKMKDVLARRPRDRSARDLEVMGPLNARVPFLRKLGDTERVTFYRVCACKTLGKGQVVFSQGDVSDRFYILIKGAVNLVAMQQKEVFGGAKVSVSTNQGIVKEFEMFGRSRENLDGEVEPRAVTAIVGVEATLLEVMEKDFDDALREFNDATRERNVAFLKRVSLFRHWPIDRLHTLAALSRDVHVPSGHVIYKQGGPCPDFFMVKMGQVRILREIFATSHTMARHAAQISTGSGGSRSAVRRDGGSSAEARGAGRGYKRGKNGLRRISLDSEDIKPTIVETERLETSGYFGEIENVRQSSIAVNTAETTTNAVLFVLPAAEFRNMCRLYPSLKRDVLGYADHRQAPDEAYAAMVKGANLWSDYKKAQSAHLARPEVSDKGVHYQRYAPLPAEPSRGVVATVEHIVNSDGHLSPDKKAPVRRVKLRAPFAHNASKVGGSSALRFLREDRGGGTAGAGKREFPPEPGLAAVRKRRARILMGVSKDAMRKLRARTQFVKAGTRGRGMIFHRPGGDDGSDRSSKSPSKSPSPSPLPSPHTGSVRSKFSALRDGSPVGATFGSPVGSKNTSGRQGRKSQRGGGTEKGSVSSSESEDSELDYSSDSSEDLLRFTTHVHTLELPSYDLRDRAAAPRVNAWRSALQTAHARGHGATASIRPGTYDTFGRPSTFASTAGGSSRFGGSGSFPADASAGSFVRMQSPPSMSTTSQSVANQAIGHLSVGAPVAAALGSETPPKPILVEDSFAEDPDHDVDGSYGDDDDAYDDDDEAGVAVAPDVPQQQHSVQHVRNHTVGGAPVHGALRRGDGGGPPARGSGHSRSVSDMPASHGGAAVHRPGPQARAAFGSSFVSPVVSRQRDPKRPSGGTRRFGAALEEQAGSPRLDLWSPQGSS